LALGGNETDVTAAPEKAFWSIDASATTIRTIYPRMILVEVGRDGIAPRRDEGF
jgi:hypothetical protein